MAASDFGATREGAIGRTPVDVDDISATSHVTTAMVDRWLNEASFKAEAIVVKMLGTTVSALSADDTEQFRELIEKTAALEIMARFQMRGTDEYRELRTDVDALRNEFKSGEGLTRQEATQVISSTPSSRTLRDIEKFSGDNFEF